MPRVLASIVVEAQAASTTWPGETTVVGAPQLGDGAQRSDAGVASCLARERELGETGPMGTRAEVVAVLEPASHGVQAASVRSDTPIVRACLLGATKEVLAGPHTTTRVVLVTWVAGS